MEISLKWGEFVLCVLKLALFMIWHTLNHLISDLLTLLFTILSSYIAFYLLILLLQVPILKFFQVFLCFRKYRHMKGSSRRLFRIVHWSANWRVESLWTPSSSVPSCAHTSAFDTVWISHILRNQLEVAFHLIF